MSKNLLVSIIIIAVFAVGMYFVVKNAKPQKEVMVPEQSLNTENTQPNAEMTDETTEPNQIPEGEFIMTTVQEGTGEVMSKDGNILGVKYVGYLEDGTSFDSNVEAEGNFEFTLGAGEVIRGWDLGLKDMKVGEVRKLVIPAEYAYGEMGNGPIAPNSTLYFEVQLNSIK